MVARPPVRTRQSLPQPRQVVRTLGRAVSYARRDGRPRRTLATEAERAAERRAATPAAGIPRSAGGAGTLTSSPAGTVTAGKPGSHGAEIDRQPRWNGGNSNRPASVSYGSSTARTCRAASAHTPVRAASATGISCFRIRAVTKDRLDRAGHARRLPRLGTVGPLTPAVPAPQPEKRWTRHRAVYAAPASTCAATASGSGRMFSEPRHGTGGSTGLRLASTKCDTRPGPRSSCLYTSYSAHGE